MDYETGDGATVLAREYFVSFGDERRGLDVEDVLYVEENGEELFEGPDWTPDDLRPSVSNIVRLSVWSAFEEV